MAIAPMPKISFLCMCKWVPFKELRAKLLEQNCNYPGFWARFPVHWQ